MNRTLPFDDYGQSVKENTITSFNLAAKSGADFVEFDVQVTQDGHPVIFHDDLIMVKEQNQILSRPISALTLGDFLSIGFQKDPKRIAKQMVRKASDGSICDWTVSLDDSLCTLKDAFEQVVPTVGFNIEVKFHDTNPVPEREMIGTIELILEDVRKYAMGRKVLLSSFHPDAVELLRRRQILYPVFFLTEGGVYLYEDPRKNSLEAAIGVCINYGLQGIVSETKAILQNPASIGLAKKANLSVLTYGELNNVAETVRKQAELGVDGVIVDRVLGIVEAVRKQSIVSCHNPAATNGTT